MSALSSEELEDIRLVTGASNSDIISDTIIQRQYDLANANAPSSDLILPYTYVYVLQRLDAVYGDLILVQRTTDHGDNERYTDPTTRVKNRLAYWEEKAGLFGGKMSTGALNLGIDTTDEWLESQLTDD